MVEIKQTPEINQALNVKLNLEGDTIQHINIGAIADGSRCVDKILEKNSACKLLKRYSRT